MIKYLWYRFLLMFNADYKFNCDGECQDCSASHLCEYIENYIKRK